MVKVLLRVVGVLVVLGGVAAAWMGAERVRDAERLDMNIYAERSQIAMPGTPEARVQAGRQNMAGWEQEIQSKKVESYVWFGAAVVALVAGVLMVLLPSTGKRKVAAGRAPARSADAAGDGEGQ